MADIALKMDPLDELRLVAIPAPDRLPGMLFLAALIHGILIIGITFNAALSDQFAEAISLESLVAIAIFNETGTNTGTHGPTGFFICVRRRSE